MTFLMSYNKPLYAIRVEAFDLIEFPQAESQHAATTDFLLIDSNLRIIDCFCWRSSVG